MKLAYQGFNISGKAVTGTLESPGLAEASEQLRRDGIFPTELVEAGASHGAARSRGEKLTGKKGKLKDLVSFCRQLAILVSAHTPLVQAIAAVERQSAAGTWRETIADLRRRVEEGSSLAGAMEAHSNSFDAIARSMVAAGESSGRLELMLRGLASMTRQQLHVRRSIVGALVYPCVLIVTSLGVLVIMLLFVLPQFQGLFETLNAPIPPTTMMLMNLANMLREYWWALLIGVGALGVTAFWWRAAPAVRRVIDNGLIHAPRIGPIVQSFATARIARVLGVLLEAKIPMLEAIVLARQGTSNSCYGDLLDKAGEAVTRGETLANVLSNSSLIVSSVSEALHSGERSGQLGPVLVQVADFLDEDNEVLVRTLTGILEPLVLAVLGIVIGFVAVSMFLPLFDLTALSGGEAP
ncbi:MAG: type II secretion system F family protein [Pyrinomonadaceae bacterium]|nr:type II secretion system F family protein [Phycisphaerales bacterium]